VTDAQVDDLYLSGEIPSGEIRLRLSLLRFSICPQRSPQSNVMAFEVMILRLCGGQAGGRDDQTGRQADGQTPSGRRADGWVDRLAHGMQLICETDIAL